MLWVLRILLCPLCSRHAHPCVLARALLRRNAHATRAPARFAVSICGTQNLGKRRNSLRSDIDVSDPKFLRSSSPALLMGGVGIAPQQRALGAQRVNA
jgi:hypothetical protein